MSAVSRERATRAQVKSLWQSTDASLSLPPRQRKTIPGCDCRKIFEVKFLSIDRKEIGVHDWVFMLSERTFIRQGAFLGILYLFLLFFGSNYKRVYQLSSFLERYGITMGLTRSG